MSAPPTDFSLTDVEPSGPVGLSRRLLALFASATGSIALTLIVVVVVGLSWVGPSFLGKSNLTIIATSVEVPLLVGTCAGFALLAGVVDLSVGSCAGMCGVLFAYLSLHNWGAWQAAGIIVIVGLVVGAVNAVVVVGFRANSLAATLGMLTALSGFQFVLSGTTGGVTKLIPGLYSFTYDQLGPVPLIFVLLLGLAGLAYFVVAFTRVGRHVRAVGGDELAARRAGISVVKIRTCTFLVSGVGAALAGTIYVGQLGGASNNLGANLVLEVYASLMIGGYSIIRGGVGNPAGGAMGLLVIAGVTEIISVKAINTYYTDVILGLLLLLSVLFDRLRGGDSFE
jgi:ribose transport system permease protein